MRANGCSEVKLVSPRGRLAGIVRKCDESAFVIGF